MKLNNVSPEEKAYLMGLQSQSFKEDGLAKCSMTNLELANKLNISTKTIQRHEKTLYEKGILHDIKLKSKDEAGYNKIVRAIDLAVVCQAILFVDDKINAIGDELLQMQNTDKFLIEENKQLRKKLENLEQQLYNKGVLQNSFEM